VDGARPARESGAQVLRVCADPNNLPFSNEQGEGFENALAHLVAGELGRRVEYTWWPQRRGFFRTTLRAGVCDVVMGVPEDFEMALTTRPYYRSTYVFVTRRDRNIGLSSMDDPRLRRLSIGIHLVGDDYANVPPGDALVSRGIVRNVKGYSIYGDYAKPNPPADLIDAVADGSVDVAVAWGPLAGYFAAVSKAPLAVSAVDRVPGIPFEFSISMGVRQDDRALRDRLDDVLARRAADIDRILDQFHVPRVAVPASDRAGSPP
jgi:quinoprotein dehydrogenase-associated probable ABC transporter substrate-binding protein